MKTRQIVARTSGNHHGPITRVVSPSNAIAESIKPFVFLDYFKHKGPFEGFGLHPHSGIATLTYIIEGETNYIDTSGKTGVVKAGGLEWMRAGGGAWHGGYMPGEGMKRGFQLWVSLPPGIEDGEAKSFYAAPEEVKHEGNVHVLLGSYGKAKSPFETPTPMNYFHVRLKDGERWHYDPPKGHKVAWVYSYQGTLKADGTIANEKLAVFEASESPVDLQAVGDAAFMFGSAIPHNYPLVLGQYSVHTNAQSLEDSQNRILQIERRLVKEGKLNLV